MKIVNIVCSGDLRQPVPFQRLPELTAGRYAYDAEHYHGAYLLLTTGKATVYRSGKYIIYGLKALDDVDRSYQELLALLSPIIDPELVSPPRVQNIVGMEDFGMEISLTKLVVALQMEQVEYEPEQFPGVIYRGEKGTALIFSSGKVVLTGFKDTSSMEAFASGLKEKIEMIA
jgi:transcription initiation factor TFIID TATA-box-binding protein